MSRFACASSQLGLGVLIRRGRKIAWVCLMGAVTVHVSLAQLRGAASRARTSKPLTTQFIKRQPRLSKPLELKKRPQPKRRALQRRMVSVQARAASRGSASSFQPAQAIRALARPRVHVGRGTSAGVMGLEPPTMAETIQGSREPKDKVDVSLEMIDVEALDTGEYQAMVIQDPEDRRNVRGFFHLAIVYSVSMRDRSMNVLDLRARQGLCRLVQAMNRYTHIRADIAPRTYTFDSREMLNTPWIYAQALRAFKSTESEAANLGKYFMVGGFLFTENVFINDFGEPDPGEISLRQMIDDALVTQGLKRGKDWEFEVLPNDHPLFHCFFDFNGAPLGRCPHGFGGGARPRDYLEGVYIGQRLTLIYTNMGYCNAWGDWGRSGGLRGYSPDEKDWDPTRQFQFGVNLLVFALTQEGSITNRVMDALR